MKSGLKFSLSIGAFLSIIVYVAGFTWQYTYLGIITNDIGWINIVTSDYVHLGVMAIIFVMEPWQLGALILVFGVFLSGFLDGATIRGWNYLSYKNKNRFHGVFDFYNSNIRNNLMAKRVCFFVFLLFLSLGVIIEISKVSSQHMAQRLTSEGVDRVCDKNGSCDKGKVLYVGDKQVYFYSFEGEKDITNGSLVLVSVSDVQVFIDWSEKGRDLINSHIEDEN